MREGLFPRLIRLRADDELAHNLAELACRDKLTLSEFSRCALRNALAARAPVSPCPADDDGPGPFRPALSAIGA
jgi:Ribbon-helix-helix protein, copG family